MAITLPVFTVFVVFFFAFIIWLGLRLRSSRQKAALSIRAAESWPELYRDPGPENILYGIFTDISLTVAGLLVRDGADREIAVISYKQGKRSGWLDIRVKDGPGYKADVLNTWTWFRRVELRPDAGNDGSGPLCSYSRTFRESYYDIGGLREFSVASSRSSAEKVFAIKKNGQAAGTIRPVSRVLATGAVLALPREIPLYIRLFILALEYRRCNC